MVKVWKVRVDLEVAGKGHISCDAGEIACELMLSNCKAGWTGHRTGLE